MNEIEKEPLSLQESARLKVLLEKKEKSDSQWKEVNSLCRKISLFDHLSGSTYYDKAIRELRTSTIKAGQTLFQEVTFQVFLHMHRFSRNVPAFVKLLRKERDKKEIIIVLLGYIDVVLVVDDGQEDEQEIIVNTFSRAEYFWWDEQLCRDHRGTIIFKCFQDAEIAIISKQFFDSISEKVICRASDSLCEQIMSTREFSSVGCDVVKQLVDSSTLLEYEESSVILKEGDVPSSVLMLLKGSAEKTIKIEGDPKPFVLQTLKNNQFVGASEILSSIPFSYTLTATQYSTFLSFPPSSFLTLPYRIKQIFRVKPLTQQEKNQQLSEIKSDISCEKYWKQQINRTVHEISKETALSKKQFHDLLRSPVSIYPCESPTKNT